MRQARFTLGGGSLSRILRLIGIVASLLVAEEETDLRGEGATMASSLRGIGRLLVGRQSDGEVFAFQIVGYFAHYPVIAMLTQQDDSR